MKSGAKSIYDIYDSSDICELSHRKDHNCLKNRGLEKSMIFTSFRTHENQALRNTNNEAAILLNIFIIIISMI